MPMPFPAPGRFPRDIFHIRNSAIDEMFYNVRHHDKEQILSESRAPDEGSIIYVPKEDGRKLAFYPDAVAFLSSPESRDTGAIAIAGVGSSAVGSVALARDVAAALDVPVAAVVAGYGLSDCMMEGFGGAVCLRGANQLEFMLQQVRRTPFGLLFAGALESGIEEQTAMGGGPDLSTLKSLLRGRRMENLRWLVGHSKGNLLIASALYELEGGKDLEDVEIVLLSALVYLPNVGRRRHQIIGGLDWFGMINSRLDVGHRVVPGASHYLNREFPFHLDAVAELRVLAPPAKKAETTAAAG